ncbi:dTDP-glucose 4,6-dehydratase [compost metagenome]
MNHMNRVLVAGGAGFIGSHLVDRLLAEGLSVLAVDNLITGSPANLAHLREHPRFTFLEHDVCLPLSIDGPLDWVLNLASPASPVDYLQLPMETLKVGAMGSHTLLELAKTKDAKYFFASTSEVYGDPLLHPQQESYWGNVNPIGPRSVYDEAKRYGEAMTMAYLREYGVDTRIVRIFNTYGPRNRANDGRVVPSFINQALRGEPLTVFGDGSQTRSFQYVSDLVDGIRRLMDSNVTEPVNIGNPTELTVLEFAHLILKLTGSASHIEHRPLPQDDPKVRRPDISRAKALLDWEPRVPVEAGLTETIRWYQRPMDILTTKTAPTTA